MEMFLEAAASHDVTLTGRLSWPLAGFLVVQIGRAQLSSRALLSLAKIWLLFPALPSNRLSPGCDCEWQIVFPFLFGNTLCFSSKLTRLAWLLRRMFFKLILCITVGFHWPDAGILALVI